MKLDNVVDKFSEAYAGQNFEDCYCVYYENKPMHERNFCHIQNSNNSHVYITSKLDEKEPIIDELKRNFVFHISKTSNNGSVIENGDLYYYDFEGYRYKVSLQHPELALDIIKQYKEIKSDIDKRQPIQLSKQDWKSICDDQYYVANPHELRETKLAIAVNSFLRKNSEEESMRALISLLARTPQDYRTAPLYNELFYAAALEKLEKEYIVEHLGVEDIYLHHIRLAYCIQRFSKQYSSINSQLLGLSTGLITSSACYAYVFCVLFPAAVSASISMSTYVAILIPVGFLAGIFVNLAAFSAYDLVKTFYYGIQLNRQKEKALAFANNDSELPKLPPDYDQHSKEDQQLNSEIFPTLLNKQELKESLVAHAKQTIWQSDYNFSNPLEKNQTITLKS